MIFVFNGPPGSGKDICCDYLKTKGFIHIEFKEQLFADTIEYFGVTPEWFFDGYTRDNKDVKGELLENRSRREALIFISEQVMKPKYGQGYYGFKASEKMTQDKDYCISDGGFVSELKEIINKFGADEIRIIRLYRNGYDYSHDSRKYVNFEEVEKTYICGYETDTTELQKQCFDETVPVKGNIIHNNSNMSDLYLSVEDILRNSNVRKNSQ